MDPYLKGVTIPISLESLEKDLSDGVITLISNPTSLYIIYKNGGKILLTHKIANVGGLLVSLSSEISLFDVHNFLVCLLENRIIL